MDFDVKVDDAQVLGAIHRLLALGRNATPIMRDIAALGENSTRLRFRTETGPDGKRWKPSLRAQIHGGRTLTKDGHLAGSISSNSGRDFAEWGVNRIYAAAHQFGATIRPKGAGALRFRLANGAFVKTQKVTLPARPFLGVDDDDRADILDLVQARLEGTAYAG